MDTQSCNSGSLPDCRGGTGTKVTATATFHRNRRNCPCLLLPLLQSLTCPRMDVSFIFLRTEALLCSVSASARTWECRSSSLSQGGKDRAPLRLLVTQEWEKPDSPRPCRCKGIKVFPKEAARFLGKRPKP